MKVENTMNKKTDEQISKTKTSKRIRVPKIIRLTTIGIIAIMIVFSIYNVNAAYNKPEITKKTYETLSYNHNGNFDYKVYLLNNTVYEGKEYLAPGEGKYFKKIIKNINASFKYNFYITSTAEISGHYSLGAEIQTSQWTKRYTLITEKKFNSTGYTFNFTEEFPIDYRYYENVTNQINQETGITISNPNLVLIFNIFLSIKTGERNIIQYFTPSLNLTLGGNTLDISEKLSQTKRGADQETLEIFHQEVIDERNKWTNVTYLLIILLFVLIIITRSDVKKPSIEKTVKKIMKKYAEWIVEIEKPLKKFNASEFVYCKTMDDLMKISEELGKPVIHIQEDKNIHNFYVSENSIRYIYTISDIEKISKTLICPNCKAKISVKGVPGQTVSVTCKKCGKKGLAILRNY